MTRTLKVLIGLAVVLFFAFAFTTNTRASEEPQIVRVTLTDYQVDLSQFTATPGKTIQFLIDNHGSLSHRLVVQPYADAQPANSPDDPVVAPGTMRTIQRTLTAGVYRVECAEWDHAERGMVNVLAVQTPTQKAMPIQVETVIPFLAFVLGSAYIIGDSLGVRLTRAA
ncbi:MAG: cupredoxin domain-containing protein [Chloroflexota bacterium]|nr:cupredoxin domain-containing protein [Chloroflexota bacterium]